MCLYRYVKCECINMRVSAAARMPTPKGIGTRARAGQQPQRKSYLRFLKRNHEPTTPIAMSVTPSMMPYEIGGVKATSRPFWKIPITVSIDALSIAKFINLHN